MKRLALLAALFIVELVVVSVSLDGEVLLGQPGLPGQIGTWGPWILRGIVGFAAAFVAFAGLRFESGLKSLLVQTDDAPFRLGWIGAHTAAAILFALLSAALFGDRPSDLLAAAWVVTGLFAIVAACAGFLPTAFWASLLRRTGHVWIYAATVAGFAVAFIRVSRSMWQFTAQMTFELVQLLLRPIFPDLIVQPERLRVAAPHFGVIINQECSGLEGAGLMVVFVTVWLFLYRRDFLFPRSLLLLPAGVVTLYLLNAVRIAVLVIIGNAGARTIAVGGFHSQAGWIAFNGVAFAMTIFVPKVRWFRPHAEPPLPVALSTENPTATYLMPFLAILASGMLSRALSAEFEWLYALRFVAAAGTIWTLRVELRKLDWRSGWLGPLAGLAVLAVWIALDRWNEVAIAAMPTPLAAADPALRGTWISVRFLAAVVTVPIAEELAFRGFLLRRFSAAEFETVPLRDTTWIALGLSSLAFGFLHGDRWIAGVLAGLAFGWVARRSNRIGEAVVAHAVTNAALGCLVLLRHRWEYW